MLGFIHPYIVASYVVMIPIVGSIPMMLFYTKIEKFGMLSIKNGRVASFESWNSRECTGIG